jgi:hypothetical protein
LDYMRAKGLPFNGSAHTIDGYVAVDWTDPLEVKAAIYTFGALSVGINLPNAWTQNSVWDVTTTRIVGGHDVTALGYDAQGVLISSWGRLYKITWAAFTARKWIEELWALLGPDWYGEDRVAKATGIDLTALKDDLAKFGKGVVHDVDDPSPDPVPPDPGPSPDPGPTPGPTPNLPAKTALGGVLFDNIQVSFMANFPAGSRTGTLVGAASRKGTAEAGESPSPEELYSLVSKLGEEGERLGVKINWGQLAFHIFMLYAAVMSRSPMAVLAALNTLLVDLGFPPFSQLPE